VLAGSAVDGCVLNEAIRSLRDVGAFPFSESRKLPFKICLAPGRQPNVDVE